MCIKHFKQVCCMSFDKKGTLDVKKHLMRDRRIHHRHLYNTLCNLTVIVQSALSYQALKFEFKMSPNLRTCISTATEWPFSASSCFPLWRRGNRF